MAERKRKQVWTERLARHRSGLAALSFAESTVVPVPLEAIVAPLMVGHHRQAITIATVIWLGCIAGATLFYFLGAWLFEPVVSPVLEAVGWADDFEEMRSDLGRDGAFWTIFLVSFSPAPMQLATLGAGAADVSVFVFLLAIAASRGLRYFGLALLARVAGPKIAECDIPKRKVMLGVLVVGVAVWGGAQLF